MLLARKATASRPLAMYKNWITELHATSLTNDEKYERSIIAELYHEVADYGDAPYNLEDGLDLAEDEPMALANQPDDNFSERRGLLAKLLRIDNKKSSKGWSRGRCG